MVNAGSFMGDKEILNDTISSQKHVESVYNTYAGECVNVSLRNDFLNILKEEHDIQSDLFNEMNKRGWYPLKQADANQINQVKTMFQNAL